MCFPLLLRRTVSPSKLVAIHAHAAFIRGRNVYLEVVVQDVNSSHQVIRVELLEITAMCRKRVMEYLHRWMSFSIWLVKGLEIHVLVSWWSIYHGWNIMPRELRNMLSWSMWRSWTTMCWALGIRLVKSDVDRSFSWVIKWLDDFQVRKLHMIHVTLILIQRDRWLVIVVMIPVYINTFLVSISKFSCSISIW